MKTLLLCGAALGLLGLSVLGIPQTFNNNQFLNTAGVSFEQFAADPAAWGDVSALKGHWEAHGDRLTLTDSAAVFGVDADEVTAKQQDGQVQSFRVVFRGKANRAGGKVVDVFGPLLANIRAFTGDSGIGQSQGFVTFFYKTVQITVFSGDRVAVEFKRK